MKTNLKTTEYIILIDEENTPVATIKLMQGQHDIKELLQEAINDFKASDEVKVYTDDITLNSTENPWLNAQFQAEIWTDGERTKETFRVQWISVYD